MFPVHKGVSMSGANFSDMPLLPLVWKFSILMCEASEIFVALSCLCLLLAFSHEFSGSELPANNPDLSDLAQHFLQPGKAPNKHIPALPAGARGEDPSPAGAMFPPAPCFSYPRQADLPCLLSRELPLCCVPRATYRRGSSPHADTRLKP